jgi:hypothetical protein
MGGKQYLARLSKKMLALAFLPIVACSSGPVNASPESEYLTRELVPKMIKWGQAGGEVLDLSKELASQGFDKICLVSEYKAHADIVREVPQVKRYKGMRSYGVPESHIAVIGVAGDTAHVAYLNYWMLSIHRSKRLCRSAGSAILWRTEGRAKSLNAAYFREE